MLICGIQLYEVCQVPNNTYVQRAYFKNGQVKINAKMYRRGEYQPSIKRYQLDDCDDISRAINVKSNQLVYIDAIY